MRKILTEPLFQFLILAVILYNVVQLISPDQLRSTDENNIVVTDEKLAEYMQFQAKRFRPGNARKHLEQMSEIDRQRLIADYVREQILYREALAMGLDKNDQIIRRRLMQKMEFIARGFIEDMPKITEVDLKKFYHKNAQNYKIPATISFTHIFFSNKKHGEEESKKKALALLPALKSEQTPPSRASSFGERFIFHRNYQEDSRSVISSHFGNSFANQVFAAKTNSGWLGPFTSQYGEHLIWINSAQPSGTPPLSQVASTVLADMRREQRNEQIRKAYNKMAEKYKIVLPARTDKAATKNAALQTGAE